MTDSDLRDRLILKTVKGQTFAEVGGLYGTVGEKISVAHQAGATDLTIIDIHPEGGELWGKFHQRMKDFSINNYHCISQDVTDFNSWENPPKFDVVHCSGVLYHHPNPMLLLKALQNITRSHLILSSIITPELIENEQGIYRIPPSGVILVPALNEQERAILKVYWQSVGYVVYGIVEKLEFELEDYSPWWWWLPTATAMKSMCEVMGFKVLETGSIWENKGQTLLLSV
jgi:SAM-dependent methyltransferase